jgi:UDP-N-acetylglucosamine 1-carboxyvinyltransferase
MGANIRIEGRTAIIEYAKLHAARVAAADLRAGASLFIAGLCVPQGEVTEVFGLEYIDRGYDRLIENLTGLGANLWREPVESIQKKA